MTKRKSKGAYMISAVAEMYGSIPRPALYEREGLLKPSRTEGNTRLYTDEDLQRLEFILSLARDLGGEHQRYGDHPSNARAHGRKCSARSRKFVQYIQEEVLTRASAGGRSVKREQLCR